MRMRRRRRRRRISHNLNYLRTIGFLFYPCSNLQE
jgi:hypothetical protein